MILSPYRATARKIPKNLTIVTATPSVKIGGWDEAIVINHPLEIVSPMPPINTKAPNKYAKNIMGAPSIQNFVVSPVFLQLINRG
jgi:hypothetical protein